MVQPTRRSGLYIDFIFLYDPLVWPLKLKIHENQSTISHMDVIFVHCENGLNVRITNEQIGGNMTDTDD